MLFTRLEIENFRNLCHVTLECVPGLNLIVGANASGKTSLLEAIYFLGRLRSFRTSQVRELIHNDAERFRILAKIAAARDARHVPVGVERDAHVLNARIDGAPARSLAELALQAPLLLLNPASHRLLEDGPQQRRRFMDWGLFHSEAEFFETWKNFSAVLRQRNAMLRSLTDLRSLAAWDAEFVRHALMLDHYRAQYCIALETLLAEIVASLPGLSPVQVDYRRGWLEGQDLHAVLQTTHEQDRRHGYTRNGPQRADFVLKVQGRTAIERLSRGQQKLLVIALVVAQAGLYRRYRGHACILLVDDLPAELDPAYRDRALAMLGALDSQLFVTALDAGLMGNSAAADSAQFEICDGNLRKMI
jgi:DNA replication and repair protein RecF